jgi:hypothetical protein
VSTGDELRAKIARQEAAQDTYSDYAQDYPEYDDMPTSGLELEARYIEPDYPDFPYLKRGVRLGFLHKKDADMAASHLDYAHDVKNFLESHRSENTRVPRGAHVKALSRAVHRLETSNSVGGNRSKMQRTRHVNESVSVVDPPKKTLFGRGDRE